MSKKSWFGRAKPTAVKIPEAAPVPRTKAEIDAAYTLLCAQAGEVQYKLENSKAQLNQLNHQIHAINGEANARAKLDADEKAKERDMEVPANV